MAKLKMGRSTYADTMDKIHFVNPENIECCGKNISMTSHIDGIDFYEYNYQCECGNQISVHTKRNEEERW